jgi:hypothetical protein
MASNLLMLLLGLLLLNYSYLDREQGYKKLDKIYDHDRKVMKLVNNKLHLFRKQRR